VYDNPIAPEAAVFKAANNIFAAGGSLLGMEAVFVFPESVKEREIKELTRKVDAACRKCGAVLSGGHTEISDLVTKTLITVTAVGKRVGEPLFLTRAKAGMDLVLTKWVALEACAAITADIDRKLQLDEHFNNNYLDPVKYYREYLSVEQEAIIAAENGAVAMHDLSEGGIFSALWDLTEAAKRGFEVDLRAIPITQEAVEISTFFDLNPYRLKSAGSLLIVCEDGALMEKCLEACEIPAKKIGRITDNNDKIILNADEIRYLEK